MLKQVQADKVAHRSLANIELTELKKKRQYICTYILFSCILIIRTPISLLSPSFTAAIDILSFIQILAL